MVGMRSWRVLVLGFRTQTKEVSRQGGNPQIEIVLAPVYLGTTICHWIRCTQYIAKLTSGFVWKIHESGWRGVGWGEGESHDRLALTGNIWLECLHLGKLTSTYIVYLCSMCICRDSGRPGSFILDLQPDQDVQGASKAALAPMSFPGYWESPMTVLHNLFTSLLSPRLAVLKLLSLLSDRVVLSRHCLFSAASTNFPNS